MFINPKTLLAVCGLQGSFCMFVTYAANTSGFIMSNNGFSHVEYLPVQFFRFNNPYVLCEPEYIPFRFFFRIKR